MGLAWACIIAPRAVNKSHFHFACHPCLGRVDSFWKFWSKSLKILLIGVCEQFLGIAVLLCEPFLFRTPRTSRSVSCFFAVLHLPGAWESNLKRTDKVTAHPQKGRHCANVQPHTNRKGIKPAITMQRKQQRKQEE